MKARTVPSEAARMTESIFPRAEKHAGKLSPKQSVLLNEYGRRVIVFRPKSFINAFLFREIVVFRLASSMAILA